MRKYFAFIFPLLLCGTVSAPLMAQTTTTTATDSVVETEKPISMVDKSPSSGLDLSGFATDLLNDQKEIWTAPFHIKRGDVAWLAPISAGGLALFAFDHRISDAVKGDTALRTPSNVISDIGLITPYAVPGTMWFLGAVTHNPHTLETGRLGMEAELDAEVIMNVIKIATNRARPNLADNRSFPSGHAMSSFALAAVLSSEYHDKPLVVFGSYGFATAVSLARVGGLNHFPSDVLVGAVIGELIGRYVVHHHAQLAQ